MNCVVSIIITPFYETDYVIRCLNALLRQTEKNIEIIVAQTEFDEKNQAIITEYLQNHHNIKLMDTKEGLDIHPFQRAVQQANGEWILFISVDEVLASNAIQMLLENATDDIDYLLFNTAIKQEDGLFSKLYLEEELSQTAIFNTNLNIYNHLFRKQKLLKFPFTGSGYLSEYLFLIQWHASIQNYQIVNRVLVYQDAIQTLENTSLEEWADNIQTLQRLIKYFIENQMVDNSFMVIAQIIKPFYQLYNSLEVQKEQQYAFSLLQKLLLPYQDNISYCEYIEALLNIRMKVLFVSTYSAYQDYQRALWEKENRLMTTVDTQGLKQVEKIQDQIQKDIANLQTITNQSILQEISQIQNIIAQNQIQMAQEREHMKQTLIGYVDIYDPATSVVEAFSDGKLGLRTIFRCLKGWLHFKFKRNK